MSRYKAVRPGWYAVIAANILSFLVLGPHLWNLGQQIVLQIGLENFVGKGFVEFFNGALNYYPLILPPAAMFFLIHSMWVGGVALVAGIIVDPCAEGDGAHGDTRAMVSIRSVFLPPEQREETWGQFWKSAKWWYRLSGALGTPILWGVALAAGILKSWAFLAGSWPILAAVLIFGGWGLVFMVFLVLVLTTYVAAGVLSAKEAVRVLYNALPGDN